MGEGREEEERRGILSSAIHTAGITAVESVLSESCGTPAFHCATIVSLGSEHVTALYPQPAPVARVNRPTQDNSPPPASDHVMQR